MSSKTFEDESLIDVWKTVSFYPITGTNGNAGKYYKHIYDQFNKRKNISDYATIHMIRNKSSMSHRWNLIRNACNKFHGCYTRATNRHVGSSMVDVVSHYLSTTMSLRSSLCLYAHHIFVNC
jgi:hypothetical protein